MTASSSSVAEFLNALLRVDEIPDFAGALNGLQVDHEGPVRRVGAAVDVSRRVMEQAAARGVNLLIVHHGLFWDGTQRLVGAEYVRHRTLFRHDMAVYSAHLPLDAHEQIGNNVLLARELGLTPARGFADYKGIAIGVAGSAELETASIVRAARQFAAGLGGTVRTSGFDEARQTRHWAICTGAGASTETLREAADAGIDTLIVGEGPHHTAVLAPEFGITVIYAGHYATETLGVCAAAQRVSEEFSLDWEFIAAPTGL